MGSGNGGGIANIAGSTTFKNTIIANSSYSTDCYNSTGVLAADSYNIDDDGFCGGASTYSSAQINLQPLANNGGPTQTMAVQCGSPAIDAGDSTDTTPDQRDSAGGVDIGGTKTRLAVFASIWIDKGLGMIVAGFVPTPFDEVVSFNHLESPITVLAVAHTLARRASSMLIPRHQCVPSSPRSSSPRRA